tara:strand:- start:356 stop:925 length:570 start_codon:yes stop_codon:yes gene_type:complete
MKNKKFIGSSILLGLLILLTSCPGTTKKTTTQKIKKIENQDELIKEYCKVSSDKKFFRANATTIHPDLGESEYEAVQFAKAQMAENISQKIKSVTDRYKKTKTINNVVEFDQSVEGVIRYVSEVSLSEVNVICTKVVRLQEENAYQRFVAVEMSKESLIEEIENKISQEGKLHQDYRKSEMRKILESEL